MIGGYSQENTVSDQPPRRFNQRLSGLALALLLSAGSALVMPQPTPAQLLLPEVREAFLANPLNDEPRDPLLPPLTIRRPLSPLEQYQLEQDLDRLALQAESLAEAEGNAASDPGGEVPAAEPTAIWMRELRLRRLLGVERELMAIRRVAQWMRDRASTQELQLIAARLRQIQQDLDHTQPTDQARLTELAESYAILGEVDDASVIRRALADAALVAGDTAEAQAQLETLANLQALWFHFDAAAATYGDLIELAQSSLGRDTESRYLEAQSQNLEQAQEFAAAIVAQERLLAIYNENERFWPLVPSLQQAVAENHIALGNVSEASRYLQSAYTNALAQRQLNVAAVSIRALADLYTALERWQDVRYLYEQLLLVERQANNAFGLMAAFDSLGQLYEQLNEPEAALAAYREGLVMAKSLDHRQAYFEAQIARLVGEG